MAPSAKDKIPFDPENDIATLKGQIFLITGGTDGLGRASLLTLARHAPKAIYFTGRNAKSAATVEAEVKKLDPSVEVHFLECDHSSLSSVEAAVKQFFSFSSAPRLDVLICNAGIMAKDPGLTSDGYELQFGVNHVAHALFVKMLLPTLESTQKSQGSARMVFLTSAGFRWTPSGGIIFEELKTTQDYWFAGR